ncbi:hypothetical protein ACLB2K_059072 [Fragaria x ananassa]
MVGMEVGVAALGGQQPSKDGFEWMGAHIIPGYQLLAYGEVLTRAYLVWTSLRLGFGSGTLVYAPIGMVWISIGFSADRSIISVQHQRQGI